MHYHRATHITVELQLVFMSVSPLKNLLDIIMEVQIGLWEHVKASIHISGYYLVLFVSLLLKQRERKSNTSWSLVTCQSGKAAKTGPTVKDSSLRKRNNFLLNIWLNYLWIAAPLRKYYWRLAGGHHFYLLERIIWIFLSGDHLVIPSQYK